MAEAPDVIFEDNDLLVVNKPSGMLCEGGNSHRPDLEAWATMQKFLGARCCHRLDRLTSGVVLLRKNRRLTREISALFENRLIRKSYWAITTGRWPGTVTRIDAPLSSSTPGGVQAIDKEGKPAVTTVRIRGQSDAFDCTWLELLLKTGRTHQARLHCAHVGFPIRGDAVYGGAAISEFFGLHARSLKFRHPGTGQELSLEAEPPEAWQPILKSMRD